MGEWDLYGFPILVNVVLWIIFGFVLALGRW